MRKLAFDMYLQALREYSGDYSTICAFYEGLEYDEKAINNKNLSFSFVNYCDNFSQRKLKILTKERPCQILVNFIKKQKNKEFCKEL
ncbi:hypothetical protein BpHYR1_038780 [Brachionus plicatilis]|uniref:Uncharacterized protein n=1 Tax=Brachionus plicatilis TaxID=10195 RepID=A0A3M7SZC9_BRAPC|nr:hypothetical protein BpHYR1_038780 [Brachionus plicatilis]